MRFTRFLLLLLGLTACDHTTPFTPGNYRPVGPFAPGNPVQLTYSGEFIGEVSERAAWLPDGATLLFTEDQIGRPDHDRCFARIPAAAGSVTDVVCATSLASQDSLDIFESPAIAPDGRMAFVWAGTNLRAPGVAPISLVLATLGHPLDATTLLSFPLFGPTSRPIDIVSDVHWLGPHTLMFLAERMTTETLCQGCPTDTLRWGQEIDTIGLSTAVPVIGYVSGTDGASSVAVVGSDTVYYSLGGQSAIHRRLMSSDADSVIFDFGAAGIARDVSVAAGRLLAVVAGDVSFGFDPVLNSNVQRDGGGFLHVVTLATGQDSVLSDSVMLIRRPVLDPLGKRAVAEDRSGYQSAASDLWAWTLP